MPNTGFPVCRHACRAQAQPAPRRARPASTHPRRRARGSRFRPRQSLSAHGLSARPRQHRGRHSDLPLASCALRRCERLHVRSVGGRRADVPRRDARRRDLGEAGVRAMPTRPGIGVGGSRTGSRTISASSSPRRCRASSRRMCRTSDVVRQAALFGARNRDGWGTGLTILTALGKLLPLLPRRMLSGAVSRRAARRRGLRRCGSPAASAPLCQSAGPRHAEALAAALGAVRHGEAAERTVLTAIAGGRIARSDRRPPVGGRDRPRLRRWRAFARFHQ